MHSRVMTRTLLFRLILLLSGMSIAIAVAPDLKAVLSTTTAAQIASRETLSIKLNAW